MITVEQAAYMLAQKFPQLVRCKDYWVAHPVDHQYVQTGPAWIVQWTAKDVPQPSDQDLQDWWPQYESAYNAQESAKNIREDRDQRLRDADVMSAKALDGGNLTLVAQIGEYRQALRDVPQQEGFPESVKWPVAPK